MPPSGNRSGASIDALVRSRRRADVAIRSSIRTTPFARTSLARSADETLELTSGVARATMAASSTSSVDRPAGRGCTRTCTPGFSAFHCSARRIASLVSGGFAAGQYVSTIGCAAGAPPVARTISNPEVVRLSVIDSPPGPANVRVSGTAERDPLSGPTGRYLRYRAASGLLVTAWSASSDSIVDSAPAFRLTFTGDGPSMPSNVRPEAASYIAMPAGLAPVNQLAVSPAKTAYFESPVASASARYPSTIGPSP